MGRPLVRLDVGALADHVRGMLAGAPGLPISGAFLFGSALGECRPESDIDIGVIPAPRFAGPDWGLEGEVGALLRPFQAHAMHVSVLRPGLLGFEALTTGRAVYVKDEDAVWDFVERVCRRGAEDRWRYEHALRLAAMDLLQPKDGGR